MNKKVIISADSTSDVPVELLEKYNIVTVPLHITLGGNTYDDLIDIKPDDVYAHFEKTGELPKTSAVNMQEYIDKFKPFVDDGCEVVHINIGSSLSTSHQQCKLAAKELGNVYAVDSCSLSTGSGLLVLEAVEMAEKGMSGAEIAEKLRGMTDTINCSFIVDKLDYLRAGGRCSAVALMGANLLSIKPCIEVHNEDAGNMSVGKKYRGKLSKVLSQYVNDRISGCEKINKKRAFVTHAGISEELANELMALVKGMNCFDEVILAKTNCTIASHCGPQTMGLIFMTE